MKKDTLTFYHDHYARHDEKILCLRATYNVAGYGTYWILIEMLWESEQSKLRHKFVSGIAHQNNIDITLLNDVITDCISLELLHTDGEYFWSEAVLRRKAERDAVRAKYSAAGKKGMENRYKTPQIEEKPNDVITMPNDVITEANKKKESERESKVNEIENKEKEITNKPPKVAAAKTATREKVISDEGKFFADEFRKTLPPSHKVTDTDLKNWAITFDDLIRIDSRTKDEIYTAVKFARKDEFWCTNFMSATKLRMKDKAGTYYIDIFLSKSKGQNNGQRTNSQKPITPNDRGDIKSKWDAFNNKHLANS